ncbi:MAG: putative glycoside hydrolase [Patescibacteria group bacterium]
MTRSTKHPSKNGRNGHAFLKFKHFFLFILVVIVLLGAYLVGPKFFVIVYQNNNTLSDGLKDLVEAEVIKPKTIHLPTPKPLKGIYMTSCVAGTPSMRDGLVTLIEETEINAVVIDVKDYSGTMSFKPANPELNHMWENSRCGALDMKEFIETLHQKGIYTIARVTVFQDPHLTNQRPDLAVKKKSDGSTWKDFKGLSFTDPGSKEVWDYNISIAKESYDIGFDEINFDYIRFPSDGPMTDINFSWSMNRPKAEVLEDFFAYLHENLKDTGVKLSADLFGMTTTNVDDLNIGQVWERALPHFDYLAPMVYPSHYPKDFNGWPNPNTVPYELIKFVMSSAVERTVASTSVVKTNNSEALFNTVVVPATSGTPTTTTQVFTGLYSKPVFSKDKVRPWLQDFNYGGVYDAAAVRAQIQGAYDAGLDSFMLWSPSNRYTKAALFPANNIAPTIE